MPSQSGSIRVVAVFGVAVAATLVYVGARMAGAPTPTVRLTPAAAAVGKAGRLVVEAADPSGLRSLRVAIEQDGKETVVAEQAFDPPQDAARVEWSPGATPAVREGRARLVATVRNASWGDLFRGRTAGLTHDFEVRLTPPRIQVLTAQHYVNQGGCDLVVYSVQPPGAESAVQAGPHSFPGFPIPGRSDPGLHFAVFALPYDLPADTPLRVTARDVAGNEALASLNVKAFPKVFRSRELAIDDGFLGRVVPEILAHAPSFPDQKDLLKNYLAINRDLRKANNQALAEMSRRSKPEFLWSQPFQQLSGSQVEAQFADHRVYTYRGQEIDRQDHLGFDLASTAHAPVTAANDGAVVHADVLGIYGNAVVLDHGFGLLSVYGHLSSLGVKVGDAVTRGQELGRSGATGLAGGDHLHFSMVLGDVQVDPREWWDPHWLHDRIAVKLRDQGMTTGPAALAGQEK